MEHVATGAWALALVAPRERSDLARRWTTRLPLALVIVSLVSAAIVPLLVQRRVGELRDKILNAVERAGGIDEATGRVADARLSEIQAAEQLGVVLTVLLVLLALAAALLVARLGRGYRSLALRLDESEARFRQIAEREHVARKEAEAARAAAERRRSELERVTESRARLIRGFTHDVKNPLGAADGFLALLEDGVSGGLSLPQKNSVRKARRSIRTALDLIHELLDLAQAEAGQLRLRRVVTDMRTLAREVVEDCRPQAETAGLALGLELPEGEVPVLESDPERARQVLVNLVSNAIKYTPRGGQVTIRVATRSGGSAPHPGEWVVVEVCDTGRGIPPANQEMLFFEFTRFDPDAAQGAGIGLAISQRIAQALGGAITVESEAGAGSTFTLWLPIVPTEAEDLDQATAESTAGRAVCPRGAAR